MVRCKYYIYWVTTDDQTKFNYLPSTSAVGLFSSKRISEHIHLTRQWYVLQSIYDSLTSPPAIVVGAKRIDILDLPVEVLFHIFSRQIRFSF